MRENRTSSRFKAIALAACWLLMLAIAPATAQERLLTPREHFGRNIGDDYFLADYAQAVAYWERLAQQSERIRLEEIGVTSEGRTMVMAIVTSAENHRNLDRYREIAQRLAQAEGLTDLEARALAAEGKAVVWIDGGLHANEVLGAQQLIELVYRLAAGADEETVRILDQVIVLAAIVNPDGMDLVSNWYMREPVPERRSLAGIPRLYQRYAGHDNNRDFYMSALAESQAVNRILYREWFPQIVFDHHQTAPTGTVMFTPPFRDPFNFNLDPLVITMLGEIGAAMQSRFAEEDKPGVVSRSGANYSAWWNGGLRTTPYFHNMIGILTETVGSPTPTEIPFAPSRQIPNSDLPYPAPPQTWRFAQSIEYSMTANRAVLDFAARNKDRLLFNIYRMGRNSIEKGSRDHWTLTPDRIAAAQALAGPGRPDLPGGLGAATLPASYYAALQTPEARDPRGYVIPSDQPDFLTAAKFADALVQNGVAVSVATDAFAAGGRTYPAGSYVVKTAQAFRPHVLDMFEPQDHPDDFAYPGAPPTPPYDTAGWTLAYQMGVRFERLLDDFNGPFQPVAGDVRPDAGKITGLQNPSGFIFAHDANDAFIAVNRLLGDDEEVYRLTGSHTLGENLWSAGAYYVHAGDRTLERLTSLAAQTGMNFHGVDATPADVLRLRPVRIGLWDRYGGSSAAGWTRLVLERFEFPYRLAYAPVLDAGNLAEQFDVLIFADDALSPSTMPAPGNVPEEYRDQGGTLTAAATVPRLREFLEQGGTILAMGGSTALGFHLDLPISDALTETGPGGWRQPLPPESFYVPGSILQARVDPENSIAYGLPGRVDFVFDNSPVFRIESGAAGNDVRPVAWFDTDRPLRSGWAWGESRLEDAVAVLEASVGNGKIVLYGPEILFRAQSHGTFKLLFNGIYSGIYAGADAGIDAAADRRD